MVLNHDEKELMLKFVIKGLPNSLRGKVSAKLIYLKFHFCHLDINTYFVYFIVLVGLQWSEQIYAKRIRY